MSEDIRQTTDLNGTIWNGTAPLPHMESATMADDEADAKSDEHVRRLSRRSQRVTQLLNEPCNRKTPLGTDSAWALKLKDAVGAAVCEMHVQVLSARPVRVFAATELNDMLFELETDRGRLQATRTRTGSHIFNWL